MVIVLQFQTLYSMLFRPKFCFLCSSFLKYLVEMANSVDPDQTAPSGLQEQSDLGLHCLHMPFCETLRCINF